MTTTTTHYMDSDLVLTRGVPTAEFLASVSADFGPAFEQAWQTEQAR